MTPPILHVPRLSSPGATSRPDCPPGNAAFAAGSSSTLVSPIQKSSLISYLYNLVLPNKKCVKTFGDAVAIEKSDYFTKYTHDFLSHCRISEFLRPTCR
jgi:hypothetical protein